MNKIIKFKSLKLIIAVLILFVVFAGCSDSELTENPPHIIGADNLYKDLAGFEAGLNGLYAQYARERAGSVLGSGNNLFIDMATSAVDNAYGNFRAGWAFVGNNLDTRNNPSEVHNRRFFEWIYTTINAANTIITRAENPDVDWTQEDKSRVVAEARLIRAWAYRHATYLWGDVPLSLEESSGSTIRTDWTRNPVAEVRNQMLEDLLFAEANLPETSSNPGKAVKGVATHYLSELYLTIGDNENAKAKAESLINSGIYSLVTERYGVKANQPGTPYSDMFLDGNSNKSEGNTEALWVMQQELETTGGGKNIMRRWHRNRSNSVRVDGITGAIIFSVENGGRGIGRIGPTRYAMELYEPNDDRGGIFAWRTYEVLNNPNVVPPGRAIGDTIWFNWQGKDEALFVADWPSTRKWDYANPNNLSDEENYNDQVYLRLAETYLLLAEAQFKLGDPSGSAETINHLRRRANASEITGGDVSIDFILDERSRELYSEEHRKYTLTRLGRWLDRMQLYNKVGGPKAGEKDKLSPIPQTVIDANIGGAFEQNPGY
ncbi:RagB/SusD family nutrient uptake outer membrane protein [Flavivirga spongiicola]|uniref:RagB/SusD family nutrient uptake outer membrane protein n=1 Tax=Flavivirga spongiicola TaxID=421621 RepID=A0ABU7XWR0_9FLAO|nr:RagB/SusD family nutrient uptake outer membrane protein [Flavivirga sp. MEBiC05379]MDO5980197.1 RagB/SusD family nutrient uptake outer membrane protein [Flavivirga sp. MEBiC05379]